MEKNLIHFSKTLYVKKHQKNKFKILYFKIQKKLKISLKYKKPVKFY